MAVVVFMYTKDYLRQMSRLKNLTLGRMMKTLGMMRLAPRKERRLIHGKTTALFTIVVRVI
jgi:hypothetical protein